MTHVTGPCGIRSSIGRALRRVSLSVVLVAACGPAEQPSPVRAPGPVGAVDSLQPRGPVLRLLDRPAVMAVERIDELPLSRVEVRWWGRTDTIPGVLVQFIPDVVADSTLTGLDWAGPTLARGFVFRHGARTVEAVDLPGDLQRGGAVVRLSPGGRYLAYVAEARCGASHCARVSVRRWPSLALIGAHQLAVKWGDRLDPRDRIDWLDPMRVAFELYDGQRAERTVAVLRLAAGGLQVVRQAIPR
jgi:hypothetical protein